METAEKKLYGTFLQDRIVKVKPVESSGKWNTLLVAGQDNKKDPFLYNKVKRSFQVPWNPEHAGGGIKRILDNEKRVHIKKYESSFPNGMTEQEFFERELGVDLKLTAKAEENFWRTHRLGRVPITKEGLTLNLNETIDMLKYKILLSNISRICPSYDDRLRKATYEFMMVDEGKVTSQRIEEAKLKSDAYIKYSEVSSNKKATIGFIKSLGRTIPAQATEDWLKGEVLSIVEKDPKYFLEIVNHPQYQDRIFIQEAIEAGAIIRKADRRYVLDNGIELGDLTDAIAFISNLDNQEVKMRVKSKIDLTKRN
jgi:hypothetical protein